MAVVTVLTMIEDEFGITVGDDEVSADVVRDARHARPRSSTPRSLLDRSVGLDARFIEGDAARLFVLLRQASERANGASCVLLVPPFARGDEQVARACSRTSRIALAKRGVATRVSWISTAPATATASFATPTQRCGARISNAALPWSAHKAGPSVMLAVRLGCILGAARDPITGLKLGTVLWQPVLDGKRFLDQFLRLRVAASMMSDTGKESVEQLRAAMRDGALVEVAGYELGAALADQLEQLNLPAELGAHLGRVHWIELIRDAAGAVGGASRSALEAARARGVDAVEQAVVGEPFWSSVEIVRNPELVARTVAALSVGA